jgi:hypothetical protein
MKPKKEHVIQANYGYGQGWEDIAIETDPEKAQKLYRAHRRDERYAPVRLISREVNPGGGILQRPVPTASKLDDPEECCMHESGCTERATRFESAEGHWHDRIWCDEHATGRTTEPLRGS